MLKVAVPNKGSLSDEATVILRESGGRYTQFDGSPVGAWTQALATNGRLHEAAAGVLRAG